MMDAEFSEQARVMSGLPSVVHGNRVPLRVEFLLVPLRVESGAPRSSHFGT